MKDWRPRGHLRFQRRFKLGKRARVNVGKGGPRSITLGCRGFGLNLSGRGVTLFLGIPGTGLSYRYLIPFPGRGRQGRTRP